MKFLISAFLIVLAVAASEESKVIAKRDIESFSGNFGGRRLGGSLHDEPDGGLGAGGLIARMSAGEPHVGLSGGLGGGLGSGTGAVMTTGVVAGGLSGGLPAGLGAGLGVGLAGGLCGGLSGGLDGEPGSEMDSVLATGELPGGLSSELVGGGLFSRMSAGRLDFGQSGSWTPDWKTERAPVE